LFPTRFALVGPSAGWSSFYSYTGRARPGGPFARSQASSDTNVYLSNLAQRSVYIIHGDADDNVPVREGRDMYFEAGQITGDITYHEQPGAGHWWNVSDDPGADCVNWPPMFDIMRERRLDPFETDFDFRTPSPQVSPTHAFVTLRSQHDPWFDSRVTSIREGEDTVRLTTENVRSLTLNGPGLLYKGIRQVIVDDEAPITVTAERIPVGPQEGKRPGVHGPFNEVMSRPFCFIYAPDGSSVYPEYAAYLASNWSAIGNGHTCALPITELTDTVRQRHNLIYLGIPQAQLDHNGPFDWDSEAITVGDNVFTDTALAMVFPEGDRLSAIMTATTGSERLLFTIQPFTSSFALPDFFLWSAEGGLAGGFFTPDWNGIAPPPE
ncbi:MAG: hypothetical protein AAFS10_09960, partial [Myxococcota bacterium]